MKKTGFTLIELLGVVIIIGLLGLLVYPNISNMINDSKNTLYKNQIRVLEAATKDWSLKNPGLLGDKACVNVNTLISEGYIESEQVVDPKGTDHNLDGCMVIEYNETKKRRTYEYVEAKCEELEVEW